MKKFDKNNTGLCNQFENICWIEESGISESELKVAIDKLTENKKGLSKAIIKAKTFELIATRSRIAIDKNDIFQDKLFGKNMIAAQRWIWENDVVSKKLNDVQLIVNTAIDCGAYRAASDFGHTSPNSKLLLDIGFTGLLDRINKYSDSDDLTRKQKEFYESCKIYIEAVLSKDLPMLLNLITKKTVMHFITSQTESHQIFMRRCSF